MGVYIHVHYAFASVAPFSDKKQEATLSQLFNMSPTDFALLIVSAGALWWFILQCRTMVRHHGRRQPPGPVGLPVIGHLHMLGKLPHRSLYKLSQKYGPIMSIRLGSVPTIIVSSPSAAELFLRTHDTVFASRPNAQAAEYLSYGSKGMAFSKYGSYWRSVRKFCTMELLSVAKIDSMARLRREELGLLVQSLKVAARTREVVDFSEKVARLIEDMTCRMLFGKSRDERFDLSKIIHELAEIAGAFNVADYVPFLGAFDLQVSITTPSVSFYM